MVRRGLVATREEGRRAVDRGAVLVSGAVAEKPSRLVDPAEPIRLSGERPRFVSRGGEKLDAALARFGVDVRDRIALDAGASSGGFTHCLLSRGAARVFAVDVGYGQLDQRLRSDPRVEVRERLNVRLMRPSDLDSPNDAFTGVDVVVADLSFISLKAVVPVLCGEILRDGGDIVVLVKPQFEAGKAAVGRGKGVIKDPAEWRSAIYRVSESLIERGCSIIGVMVSPLTGPAGNREFLIHAAKDPTRLSACDLDLEVASATSSAAEASPRR
ncbi:MAG: TlyA family RNA methyltransferase [Actinobacteria bacterium]|nr:TlyA family RNA methyltransferase [Actinomycetota bacterium]